MKRFVFAFVAVFALCVVGLPGCGGPEGGVVEAPPEGGDSTESMEGMSDEEYNKQMEESMGKGGN